MFSNVRSFTRCVAVLVYLLAIGFELSAAAAEPLDSSASLRTIYLPLSMQSSVTSMLRRSETFREQCQRLSDAPLLIVRVEVDPLLVTGTFRARTIFRRYSSGLLLATVSVGPGGKQTEWIAHEFEHVLEQLCPPQDVRSGLAEGVEIDRIPACCGATGHRGPSYQRPARARH